jgi:hypothetical protein
MDIMVDMLSVMGTLCAGPSERRAGVGSERKLRGGGEPGEGADQAACRPGRASAVPRSELNPAGRLGARSLAWKFGGT